MNLSAKSKYSICSIITDLIDDSHDHEPKPVACDAKKKVNQFTNDD